jgi:hypothetical protein
VILVARSTNILCEISGDDFEALIITLESMCILGLRPKHLSGAVHSLSSWPIFISIVLGSITNHLDERNHAGFLRQPHLG